MNSYNIYKVFHYSSDDEFFIIYSRQRSTKRQYTLRRNAIHGCKSPLYNFIRKIGVDTFRLEDMYDDMNHSYRLSLEEAKEESFHVKEREKTYAINRHKKAISLLEDDIEELLILCEAKFSDKFINENREKIEKLEERIQNISKL